MSEKNQTIPAPVNNLQEMRVIVPVAFMQILINYLQTKPYGEVYGLIGDMMQFPKFEGE